jgi:hypothetical protein
MVKCTKGQVRRLKTALRWKIPPRPSNQGSSQHHEKALSGRPSVLHDRILAMPAALVTRVSLLWRRRNRMLPIWPTRLIPS